MPGEQIRLGLTIDVNDRQARKQIQELSSSLQKLTSMQHAPSGEELPLTKEMRKAKSVAAELETIVKNATNVNTGRMDLSKFRTGLQASGRSLQDFATQLKALGPEGVNTFNQLTKSVLQAEIPIRKSATLVDKLWGSLKNVASWQISSSVLRGFTSGIRDAYGYAQDLNESLNNIRIVTKQSTDQMASFAKTANRMAKQLSASTLDYTNAALIYYQQGLNDQEVKERTDVTIKMANVTGESAATVSEWMTAIWNNFDDGTESLEHYADVMTALGAATASSSREIAEGIEKFAAIGDTVGLSYENAAAALATVTATTRQSADVVGTAFKTMFARIQDLELGETLEDGTTLGQYSQALEKVGVNIKDANGSLKAMDQIIDEIGTRWKTLDADQQTALAQNVAGIRQYTQFMALMNNYDFYKQNQMTAAMSEGELQAQQEIFAESWEASAERVQASLQSLYDDLINDEFFIKLNQNIASFVDGIGNVIKGMGGVKGLLATITPLALQLFGDKMLSGIQNISDSRLLHSDKYLKETQGIYEEILDAQRKLQEGTETQSKSEEMSLEFEKQRNAFKQDMLFNSNRYGEETKIVLQQEQKLVEAAQDRALAEQQTLETMEAELEALKNQTYRMQDEEGNPTAFGSLVGTYAVAGGSRTKKKNAATNAMNEAEQSFVNAEQLGEQISEQLSEGIANPAGADKVKQAINKLLEESGQSNEVKTKIQDFLKDLNFNNAGDVNTVIDNIKNGLTGPIEEALREQLNNIFKNANIDPTEKERLIKEIVAGVRGAGQQVAANLKQQNQNVNESNQSLDEMKQRLQAAQDAARHASNQLSTVAMSGARALMSISSVTNAVKGFIDVINNEDTTFFEKTLGVLSSMGTIVMSLTMGIKAFREVFSKSTIEAVKNTAVTLANAAAAKMQAKEHEKAAKKIDKNSDALEKNTADNVVNTGSKEVNTELTKDSSWKQIFSSKGGKEILTKAGGIALIVAGVAAVVASIGLYVDYMNRWKKSLDAAQESVRQIKDEYQEAQNAVNDFSNTLNNYNSAVEATSKLVAGTQEYTESVKKANDEAIKLLDTYDGLTATVGAGGLIQLDADELEKAQAQLDTRARQTQASYFNARSTANQAEIAYNRSENAKQMHNGAFASSDQWAGLGMSAGVGAGIGIAGVGAGLVATGAAASVIPVVGWIVGGLALVTGAILMATDAFGSTTDQEITALSALEDAVITSGDGVLATRKTMADALGEFPEIAEQIKSMSDDQIKALQENTRSNVALSREIIQQNKLSLAAKYGDTSWAKASSNAEYTFQSLANYTGTQAFQKRQQEIIKDLESGKDTSLFTWDSTQKLLNNLSVDRRIVAQWAKNQGFGDLDTDWRINSLSGGNVKISRFTEDQGWQAWGEEISMEQIKNQLSHSIAMDEVVEEYRDQVQGDLKQLTEDLNDNGLRKALGDAYESTIQKLENSLAAGAADLSDWSADAVKALKDVDFAKDEYDTMVGAATKVYAQNVVKSNNDLNAAYQYDAEKKEDLSKALGEADMNLDDFDGYVSALKAAHPELDVTTEQFREIAQASLEASVNASKLAASINDLDSDDTTKKGKALANIAATLTSMFGVEWDTQKVTEFEDDIRKAAEGSEEALVKLGRESSAKLIKSLDLEGKIDLLPEDFFKNLGDNTTLDSLKTSARQVSEIFKDLQENSNIEPDFNDEKFVKGINDLLTHGIVSAQDVTQMLENLGFAPEYEYVRSSVPITSEAEVINTYSGKNERTETYHQVRKDYPAVPQLKGTKKAPRMINSNIGAINKGGTSKSGSSKSNKKEASDEIERYHVIKQRLADITKEQDRLDKAKGRAWGQSKIALMDKEAAKLKENIQLQKDYLKQIEANYKADAAAIKGYGAQFDSAGRITNYDALVTQELNRYNAGADAEDNSAVTKRYEDFKEALSQYEETRQLLLDEQDNLTDLVYKLEDAELEKINYKVELQVSLSEQDMKYIEYRLKRLGEGFVNAASAISLIAQQAQIQLSNAQTYTQGIIDIIGQDGFEHLMNGDMSALNGLTEAQVKQVQDYSSKLLDTANQMDELQQQSIDRVSKAFDDFISKSSRIDTQLQSVARRAQTMRDLVGLIGTDRTGVSRETLAELDQLQTSATQQRLSNAIAERDVLQANYASLQEAINKARADGDAAEQERLTKLIEDTEDKVLKAEDAVYDTAKEYAEAIAKQFKNAVNDIADNFSKQVSGSWGSVENMQKAFERQKKLSDLYLQDFERAYELSKLNRDISKAIDDTDNLRAKRQLAQFQERVADAQRDGVQLSKYQVEQMQKEYDLLVKRIALEDAQNAKNQVRLMRDTEGRYGYMYTADQSSIAEAQGAYEEAQYNYSKWSYDTERALTDNYLSVLKEYEDAIRNIDLTTEEGYQRFLEITEYYTELAGYPIDQLRILIGTNVDAAKGYNLDLAKNFDDTLVNKILPEYKSFDDLYGDISANINTATASVGDAWNKAQSQYADLDKKVRGDYPTLGQKIQSESDKSTKKVKELASAFEDVKNAAKENLPKAITAFETFNTDLGKKIKTAVGKIGTLVKALNAALAAKAALENTTPAQIPVPDPNGVDGTPPGSKTTEDNKDDEDDDDDLEIPTPTTELEDMNMNKGKGEQFKLSHLTPTKLSNKQKQARMNEIRKANSFTGNLLSDNQTWSNRLDSNIYLSYQDNGVINLNDDPISLSGHSTFYDQMKNITLYPKRTKVIDNAPYVWASGIPTGFGTTEAYLPIWDLYVSGIITPQQYKNFTNTYATGGLVDYTGPAWVDGTKTRPEAFLNPKQTDIIGRLAAALQGIDRTGMLSFNLAKMATPNTNYDRNLQQQVTITAEFPNATNHDEIEQAFNDLINRATQYIY